eukprot:scaffold500308_cov38-Prasinocladus_malaysianus.AAC.1
MNALSRSDYLLFAPERRYMMQRLLTGFGQQQKCQSPAIKSRKYFGHEAALFHVNLRQVVIGDSRRTSTRSLVSQTHRLSSKILGIICPKLLVSSSTHFDSNHLADRQAVRNCQPSATTNVDDIY